MKINKIALVAAMPQEARALFPSADSDSSGVYERLSGTLADGVYFNCLISGPGTDRAGEAARILCKEGPDLLISIGVSGGLAPGLAAGTLVAGTTIMPVNKIGEIWREHEKDVAARTAVFPEFAEIQCGRLLTSPTPVLTTEDKQQLYDRTGALAVDMESWAVARSAARARIPFVCIRAISDDSERGIPVEAMAGISENGKTRTGPVVKAVLKRPGLVLQLIPLALDYNKALKSLRKIFGSQ